MDLGLLGKVVVVTGASRGIGKATAMLFATEGARLVLVARGPQDLEAVKDEIVAGGGSAITVQADVTDEGAAERIVRAAEQAHGGLDIVVANAGSSYGGGLVESSHDDWERTYRLNLIHAVDLLRAATPSMHRRGGGAAVFVASISGTTPVKRRAQYASAKAAMIHAARSLALELAPDRIRVNAVSPGSVFFEGGGWDRRRQADPAAFEAFVANESPLGRLGTPEEIARAIVFVSSPAASWINGANVAVDGAQGRPSMD